MINLSSFQEIEACLYCDQEFENVASSSYMFGCSTVKDCPSCKERFTESTYYNGGMQQHVFTFTCEQIAVSINLNNETMTVNDVSESTDIMRELLLTEYPVFNFNFKNKAKLFEKIKMYMVFS